MLGQQISNGSNMNVSDDTNIHQAAVEGDLKSIKFFIEEKKVEVDAQNEESKTPLWIAAENGHLEVVRYLVDKNANLEAEDKKKLIPLEIAIKKGHLEVVKYLNENRTEDMTISDDYLFEFSAKHNCLESIDYFLEEGANIEGEGHFNDLPLHLAIRERRFEVVKHLLDKDEYLEHIFKSSDAEGNTPLHAAAEVGNLEAAKLLLKKGANIEATDGFIDQTDSATPLFIAARDNHLEVVEYLAKEGADVNFVSGDDNTPLHCAICHGPEMVRLLLKKGANIAAEDDEGNTPLDCAIQDKKLSSVLLMFSLGNGIKLTNKRLSKLKKYIKNLIKEEDCTALEKAKGLLNILDVVIDLEQPKAIQIKDILSKNIRSIISKVIPLKQAIGQDEDILSILEEKGLSMFIKKAKALSEEEKKDLSIFKEKALSILKEKGLPVLKKRYKLDDCNALSEYLEQEEKIKIKNLLKEKFPKFLGKLYASFKLIKEITNNFLDLHRKSFEKAAEGLATKEGEDGSTVKNKEAADVLKEFSNEPAGGIVKNITSFLSKEEQAKLLIAAACTKFAELSVDSNDSAQNSQTDEGAVKRHKSLSESNVASSSFLQEESFTTIDVANTNDEPNPGLVGSATNAKDSTIL